MKALKIGLIAVVTVVLLIAIALLVFAATFDADKYKPDIIRAVKEKTGRTLAIGGPISLSVFPRLGIALQQVQLSEPNSDKTFARIGKLQGSLALLPLLSREVVVDKVVVSGLSAEVVRRKDGSSNIDDLLNGGKPGETSGQRGAKQTPPGAAGTSTGSEAAGAGSLKLDVQGIDISADNLGWTDEGGTRVRATDLRLKTGRIGEDAPGKLDLSARIQGDEPKMDAKVTLTTGYKLALQRGAFRLDGMALRLAGNLPGAAGADVSVKGNVESDSTQRTLKVDGLEINAKTGQGLEVALSMPSLLSSPQRSAEGTATVTFKLNRPDLALQGKLASPVSANADAKTLQLKRLAGELNASGSSIPQKNMKLALEGALEANWDKKTASGLLNAKVDASTVKTQFNANAAGAVPSIGFSVDIDQLDLDRYLPPKKDAAQDKAGASGASGAGKGAAGADKPMDLSALHKVNLNGQVRAGRITAYKVKLDKLAAALRIANGRLDLTSLSAGLYDGSLAGSASLDAGGHAAVKQQLSGVNIGPLLRDALNKDFIEGHGNVALDVATVGLTVPAMKKALGGTASVNLRDGAVKGINLAEAFRKAKSLLGAKGAQEQTASKSEKTDFSELSASFRIHDGIAHNDDLSLKSPFIRVGGSGDVNIGADSVDYLAKASIVDTSGGQGGKELAELKGLTVPVRLSGPYDALKYRIDFGAMATEAVKQKAEEKIKEQLKDKLGDKLKGLFGK
ncbi:MAG TPA: AsmA family protein [Burkholderiales bacterium]|nr:AsmA family protein [Burkholderiales bacterium]